MKNIFTLLIFIYSFTFLTAQAPDLMSYQAVVRNASNELVADNLIGMRIGIIKGSTTGQVVYVETQTVLSNGNGLVSLQIGSGTVVTGDFANIDWSDGTYFIRTETDPNGGSNYTISGTSQLLSVPYALYAETSGSSLLGPEGPQGADGEQGPAGGQGPIGDQGPMGEKGDQGEKGDKGDQGDTGPQGTPGVDGNATGISAYQVWLNLGNTGSEEDFIASLQGPAGEQGLPGAQGLPGMDGLDGLPGLQGLPGMDGVNGLDGINGIDGMPGPAGMNGQDGAANINGLDNYLVKFDSDTSGVNSTIYDDGANHVGIGTNTPDASLVVNGFTRLGGLPSNPAIKVSKANFLSPAMQGGDVFITHGLDGDKIIMSSVSIDGQPPHYNNPNDPGYEYYYFFTNTAIFVILSDMNSYNLLEKDVVVTFMYEE